MIKIEDIPAAFYLVEERKKVKAYLILLEETRYDVEGSELNLQVFSPSFKINPKDESLSFEFPMVGEVRNTDQVELKLKFNEGLIELFEKQLALIDYKLGLYGCKISEKSEKVGAPQPVAPPPAPLGSPPVKGGAPWVGIPTLKSDPF